MNAPRSRGIPARPERRAIVLATLGFILVSAMLHMLFGGLIPKRGPSVAQAAPSIVAVAILKLDTPPPTPRPQPRPSPTPQPKKLQPRPDPTAQRMHIPSTADPQKPPPSVATTARASDQPQNEAQAAPVPAPAPPAPSSPPDYGYVVVSARFIHQVHPAYPDDAIKAGEEGTVIVLLTVGPDGVSDARIWASSGFPDLDLAALWAAKESTYYVPEVSSEPATETYRVIYTFSLSS